MSEDWRAKIDAADEKAAKKADDAVKGELDAITAQATELESIFDNLKLTDRETYDKLVEIVENATRKNESIASIVKRVEGLGDVGKRLARSIGNLSTGGALSLLEKTLKLPA